MASRTPYIGGNWKMNLHQADAVALADALAGDAGLTDGADVVVCPAFPYLSQVGQVLADAGSAIRLGAQNFYTQPDGAFTFCLPLNCRLATCRP